ncbi:hypothetical protein AT959_00520 [Dechloromonas denitrificans]|uniref:Acyltransferase 3 domain-containing protein n=1 Tax=Dechloromonas denitrificans TaxID=281362 RepID=A0A133XP70_9RHOO|nr:hypothetical protein AT959_00520 [Dechloromonas denitrificans]
MTALEKLPLGITAGFDKQDHLQVIDALRGYAILLVIAVHSVGYVSELVWPVKRLLSLGFYGVQLFFIASAVTLLMSWHRSTGPFGERCAKFLIRRFFRIAPFYYSAILIYWFAYNVAPGEFSFELLFASLFFYNAWSPYWIPTVPGWTPVPGGWSIGVEFCFYFIFPLLALLVTNLRRSLVFFGISLLVLIACSHYGQVLYPEIAQEARANFLYFWPPNHLIIFSLGFLLYHLIKHPGISQRIVDSQITGNQASAAMLLTFLVISFYGVRKFFDVTSGLPPTHLLLSMCFVPWALVLILKPTGYAINSAITGLGKVSFSAYILHFAVLGYSNTFLHSIWPFAKEGVASIAYEISFLLITVVVTRLLAEFTYRLIEQPFVHFGKRMISSWY